MNLITCSNTLEMIKAVSKTAESKGELLFNTLHYIMCYFYVGFHASDKIALKFTVKLIYNKL